MVRAANTEKRVEYAIPPVSTPPLRAPTRALARMGRVCLTQSQRFLPRATSDGFSGGVSAASACACAWPEPAGGGASSVVMPCTLGRAHDPGICGAPGQHEVPDRPPHPVVTVRVAVEAVHE